jgi:hypothetical protein
MIARQQAGDGDMPQMSANAMKPYCETLWHHLWDDTLALTMFQNAVAQIDSVVGSRALDRDLAKTQPFTEEVQRSLRRRG